MRITTHSTLTNPSNKIPSSSLLFQHILHPNHHVPWIELTIHRQQYLLKVSKQSCSSSLLPCLVTYPNATPHNIILQTPVTLLNHITTTRYTPQQYYNHLIQPSTILPPYTHYNMIQLPNGTTSTYKIQTSHNNRQQIPIFLLQWQFFYG